MPSGTPTPKLCATCGGSPTLYIAGEKQFCKAHKADAEVALRLPVGDVRSRDAAPARRGFDGRKWGQTHKRDQNLGIRHGCH